MGMVTITRPAGTARVEVFSSTLDRGWLIPAGPCQVEIPADLVPAVPGAVVIAAPPAAPVDPAEE